MFAPGVDEYVSRLQRTHKVAVVQLPESKHSGEKAKHDEGERLLAKLSARDSLVALDERGQALTSVQLAAWLGRAQDTGRDVAFVIGGDEGLSEAVRARASLVLALSAMTLPHRLARLVLVEQVYRAFSILRGEPYHKA